MFAIPREGGGTISVLVWHMAHLLALCMLVKFLPTKQNETTTRRTECSAVGGLICTPACLVNHWCASSPEAC